MTLEELGACLQQTINEHDRIILPGMGMLYSKESAPQFIKNGNALTPPSRKIFFTATVNSQVSAQESNPAALYYAKENSMEYSRAFAELEELCQQSLNTLEEQAYISIPDFGTIRYGAGLDFVFEPHHNLEFNLQNWGLDIICARKMQADKAVASRPVVNRFKAEEEQKADSPKEEDKHRTLKITAVVILAAVILFVAAMFIFKDTFMPLWERLLYTQEELQYIKGIK